MKKKWNCVIERDLICNLHIGFSSSPSCSLSLLVVGCQHLGKSWASFLAGKLRCIYHQNNNNNYDNNNNNNDDDDNNRNNNTGYLQNQEILG